MRYLGDGNNMLRMLWMLIVRVVLTARYANCCYVGTWELLYNLLIIKVIFIIELLTYLVNFIFSSGIELQNKHIQHIVFYSWCLQK